MKKSMLVVVFIASVFGAYCQSGISILRSLQTFVQKESPNALDLDRNWSIPSRDSPDKELKLVKQLSLATKSYKIDGFYNDKQDDSWHDITFLYSTSSAKTAYLSYETAKSIYRDVVSIFGNPHRTLDYGFFISESNRSDFIMQWDIGSYEMELRAYDLGRYIEGKPGIALMSLEIQPIGGFKEVIPLKAIVVRYISAKGFRNGSWQEIPSGDVSKFKPITLILDLYAMKALNPLYLAKGNIKDVTPGSMTIDANNEAGLTTMRFVLNRFSGDADVIYFQADGSEAYRLSGKTEVISVSTPNF